jgi:drug/metabolite transporter (DMT)-like permease
MATGLLVVGLWARWRRIPLKPQPGELGFLLALGLLFTVQISALNIGMNMTSPAYGAVLLNSHPIFANLIGHFVVKEDRLSWPRLCGLALAFGGICVVFLGKPGADLASRPTLGNLIVTLAGFMIGLTTVYTQRLVQTISPERPVFWQMLICLPFFLLGGIFWEPLVLRQVSIEAVFAIVYQGAVIAGFCFIVWTEMLTRHSPGSLSFFAFPTPIFGLLASAWFYGEAVTPRLWLGMAAITLGILIATRSQRGAAPTPEFRGTA